MMANIHSNALLYREIDDPQGDSKLSVSLRRLLRLDFVVFRPVLIALLGRPASNDGEVYAAVTALESFLVRRMVCGMQTRGYGTLALDLLKGIEAADVDSSVTAIVISTLNGPVGSPTEWPSDEVFGSKWKSGRFYGWFRRDRVLIMLLAIEEYLQKAATKSEPVLKFDFSKLTIEHIMPQSWMEHWPLPLDGDVGHREAAIQGIGNLTLVSGKLNPALSNSAWHIPGAENCKRAGLSSHSNLMLNKKILEGYPTEWDEKTINRRASELLSIAKYIWPSAEQLGFKFEVRRLI